MDRTLVETAVLNEVMSRKQWRKAGKGRTKIRCVGDMVRPNSMQLNIESVEPHPRVHKGGKGLDPIIWPNTGDPDLTNAGGVAARGFDVEGDETEIPAGKVSLQVISAGPPVGKYHCAFAPGGTGPLLHAHLAMESVCHGKA